MQTFKISKATLDTNFYLLDMLNECGMDVVVRIWLGRLCILNPKGIDANLIVLDHFVPGWTILDD